MTKTNMTNEAKNKTITITPIDFLVARAVHNAKLDKSYAGHEVWEVSIDQVTLRVWYTDDSYTFETTESL